MEKEIEECNWLMQVHREKSAVKLLACVCSVCVSALPLLTVVMHQSYVQFVKYQTRPKQISIM